jgi:Asp-tRNA(Asn)/Glu-tRNA(Gln) amidotransferase A subunit family amidase
MKLDAYGAASAIRQRELSAVEVVEQALDAIRRLDGDVNAFTVVLETQAREAAWRVDAALASGEPVGPLAGVPVAVKDHIWVAGELATNGSRALAEFRPDQDAAPVSRIKESDGVIIGKTNNPEFCYRGFTSNEVFGITRNPWNLERTPGGSSGGSAACVAAGMAPLAIGTDGGGSVRIPASFCGIVGLKGTFGLVPKLPGFRGWPSLLVDGSMGRSVRDVALLLEVLAGPHPADDLSYPSPQPDYVAAATKQRDLREVRVAWSVALGFAPVADDVRARFHEAVSVFGEMECELAQAHPAAGDPIPLWYRIASAEGHASEAALLEDSPSLIEPDTAQIIRAGAGRSARDYLDALHERTAYTQAWLEFFEEHDVLVTPMMQSTAFPICVVAPSDIGGVPVDPILEDWCHLCYPANLTGQPAISLPCGLGDDGLPVGLQLMTRRFDEVTLLALAAEWECRAVPGTVGTLRTITPGRSGHRAHWSRRMTRAGRISPHRGWSTKTLWPFKNGRHDAVVDHDSPSSEVQTSPTHAAGGSRRRKNEVAAHIGNTAAGEAEASRICSRVSEQGAWTHGHNETSRDAATRRPSA